MKILKISFLSIVLLFFTVGARAEPLRVQHFEGELNFGFTVPIGGFYSGKHVIGSQIGIEGRYNFEDTPWDCGLTLLLTTAEYDFSRFYEKSKPVQNNRTLAIALTGDYNFRQGSKVNPYVGTALGLGSLDCVGDRLFPEKGTSIYFAPRIGVELFHHVRIGAHLNLAKSGFYNFSMTLGVVIGGRPKK